MYKRDFIGCLKFPFAPYPVASAFRVINITRHYRLTGTYAHLFAVVTRLYRLR